MRFKNTLKLLLANSKTVVSDLIFRLVFLLIFFGIGATFVIPFIKSISSSAATIEFGASLQNLVVSFFDRHTQISEAELLVVSSWKAFATVLGSHISELAWVSVGLFVLFVFCAFLNGMANYASGVAINTYMNSLAHVDYFRAILQNFGRGFVYQLISAVINVVWTLVLAFLCGLFLHFTVGALNVFALTLALLLFVFGKAVFNALLSNFMPSVVTGENKISVAFKESISLGVKNFGSLFLQYVFLIILVFYINVSAAICTFLVGALITLPASSIIFSCAKLVNYYAFSKRKYYLDYDNVVIPAELRGNDEKFLNGIDI